MGSSKSSFTSTGMKILIIHTAFIGDIVLSTPLINKIRNFYPKSEIYYLTTPQGGEILKNNPNLKEIIIYDKKKSDKGLMGFLKQKSYIKSKRFDMVITPHKSVRSSLLSYYTKAPIRVGYQDSVASFLYTKKVLHNKKLHEVERILSFVSDTTLENADKIKTNSNETNISYKNSSEINNKNINDQKINSKEIIKNQNSNNNNNNNKAFYHNYKNQMRYEISLFPSKKDSATIENLLVDLNNKKLVLIAPGSRWKTKQWPVDYFNYVIDVLEKREDVFLVIVGGKDEKSIPVIFSERTLDLRGKTSLLEFAELIRRSFLILSNDSSPIHIASAWESIRIVSMFGPTAKSLGFFPWSKNSIVFENETLSCRPCGLHGGNSCPLKHFKCMLDLKPNMIAREILNYLDNNS